MLNLLQLFFFYVKPPDRGLEILRILFISEEENVVACMIRLREKENFAASKKNTKDKKLCPSVKRRI